MTPIRVLMLWLELTRSLSEFTPSRSACARRVFDNNFELVNTQRHDAAGQ